MADWTPGTDAVRASWMHWQHAGQTEEDRAAEFERWLAAHDAEVRAAGLPVSAGDRESLAYLITAKRFHQRGIQAPIHREDVEVSLPMADFLLDEGYRRVVPNHAKGSER